MIEAQCSLDYAFPLASIPMIRFLRRFFRRSFRQAGTINNEPLNRVSLGIILVIDLFILINVFTGLNDIAQWPLSPTQAYPCYTAWVSYRQPTGEETALDRDYTLIQSIATDPLVNMEGRGFRDRYAQTGQDKLGQVAPLCLEYGDYQDAILQGESGDRLQTLGQQVARRETLEAENRTIREQYDSTLLEELAGQPPDQSINQVPAAEARATLDRNQGEIEQLTASINTLRQEIIDQPDSQALLTFLQTDSAFQAVEQGYNRAAFWYPSQQIGLQGIFLLPLIVTAGAIHRHSQRRGYGLAALLSWHLLVIFCIPLVFKLFEFLQAGVILAWFLDIVTVLLGGLLFLVSYLYILLIPLVGFGLIKFFQRFVFNPRVQAANRVQKSRCIRCAHRLQPHDVHCPHCGYNQYHQCPHCHTPTYRYLPHCRHCGQAQTP